MEPNNTAPGPSNNGPLPESTNTNDTNIIQPSSSPLTPPIPIVITPDTGVVQPIAPTVPPASTEPLTSQGASTITPATTSTFGSPPNTNPVLGVPIVEQPLARAQSFAGGSVPSSSMPGHKLPKKKLMLGALLTVLIIGGAFGYVFGFYIPNKPANVFQTGLSRSGANLTKLVDKFTTTDKLTQLENSEVTATVDAKSSGSLRGSLNGKFDVKLAKTKSDGSLDVKVNAADQPEKALNFKFLTDLPADKQYPNLYFQINGLKSLGLDALSPEIAAYEGKWIAVESDYLQSISSGQDAPKNKENVTSAEVASLIRTISNTSNEYMLTSDKDKAILENKAFVGKENVDGLSTYHYTVGINKDHAKDYCKTLADRVMSEPVYKKLLNLDDAGVADQKKNIAKDCDDSVNSIKDDTTLDMWIDSKYKLIHKLRIYDENDKGIYTDIGQTYTGGDKISFFVAYHSGPGKSDAELGIDVDTKAFTSKGTLTWNNTGIDPYDVKVTFEAKPYAGEVKADKPTGAISIKDVLSKLGFEQSNTVDDTSGSDTPVGTPPTSVQSRAKDTERQTDIKAIYSQLEAYYAQHGLYPTQGDLNNAAWRATNMRGLDNEALKDPDGSAQTLADHATSKQYGYLPDACTKADNGCQTYTLSALLSTGVTYSKQNLN